MSTILPDHAPTDVVVCLDADCPTNREADGTCPACGRLARRVPVGPGWEDPQLGSADLPLSPVDRPVSVHAASPDLSRELARAVADLTDAVADYERHVGGYVDLDRLGDWQAKSGSLRAARRAAEAAVTVLLFGTGAAR